MCEESLGTGRVRGVDLGWTDADSFLLLPLHASVRSLLHPPHAAADSA